MPQKAHPGAEAAALKGVLESCGRRGDWRKGDQEREAKENGKCLYPSYAFTHTHTHTHTHPFDFMVWIHKAGSKTCFSGVHRKSFPNGNTFFGGTTKHKPTEPTADLGELPSPQRGHPRINTPHWHQSPELSEFHDPSSETQVRVHIHTLPRSKAGGNGVNG